RALISIRREADACGLGVGDGFVQLFRSNDFTQAFSLGRLGFGRFQREDGDFAFGREETSFLIKVNLEFSIDRTEIFAIAAAVVPGKKGLRTLEYFAFLLEP